MSVGLEAETQDEVVVDLFAGTTDKKNSTSAEKPTAGVDEHKSEIDITDDVKVDAGERKVSDDDDDDDDEGEPPPLVKQKSDNPYHPDNIETPNNIFTAIGQCLSNSASVIYETATISISVADVATDVLIMKQFYDKERYTFFWIAAAILILAQFSYIFAFVGIMGDNFDWKKKILVALLITPISPFLSFIFWATGRKGWCSKFFDSMGFECDPYENTTEADKQDNLGQWIERKIRQHFGFLLEAFFEAFPQSILQMISIVYYQETQLLNIISILISMLSMSTKSVVFSQSIDVSTFLFNWLCIIADFWGFFCTISWVFYSPNEPGSITLLGEIWIYKVVCGTMIGALWMTIGIMLSEGCSKSKKIWDDTSSAPVGVVKVFLWQLLLISMGSIGFLVSSLMGEIFILMSFPIMFIYFSTTKFDVSSAWYYRPLFRWIREYYSFPTAIFAFCCQCQPCRECVRSLKSITPEERDTFIEGIKDKEDNFRNKVLPTSKQSLDMKLALVNLCMSRLKGTNSTQYGDVRIAKYLQLQMRHDLLYDVDLCKLVQFSTRRREVRFFKLKDKILQPIEGAHDRLSTDWGHIRNSDNCQECSEYTLKLIARTLVFCYIFIGVYILLPVYILGRLFSFAYPFIVFALTDWDDVEILQLGITSVYGVFIIVLFVILLPQVWVFVRSTWFILPGQQSYYNFKDEFKHKVRDESRDMYEFIADMKYRNEVIHECMGDPGYLVIEYLGSVEHFFEEHGM